MRSIHCFIGMRTTGCPPTSLLPSITSSFASTVPSSGHQLTGHLGLVGEAALVELAEDPLGPLVRRTGIEGVDLARPVVGEAERLDLPLEVLSMLRWVVITRVHVPGLDRVLLRGRPKASQPIGWSTSNPRIRLKRAMMSVAV